MNSPWTELDAAYERHEQAQRHGGKQEQEDAKTTLEATKDSVALLGILFLTLAQERMPTELARALRRIIDDIVKHALNVAEASRRQAKFAADEANELRERVRMLEEQVARLTPGIGEPK